MAALATALVAFVALSPGCRSEAHTIYVPEGKSVRLRQDIEADVWVLDAAGKPVASRLTIPEGWYCLPLPQEDYDGSD